MWFKKYHPQSIDDCILAPEHDRLFRRAIDQRDIPNLLLVGTPGLGKTTVAKILIQACGYDCYQVNASMDSGLDKLRSEMVGFAAHLPLFGAGKALLLDEADGIRAPSQAALRGMFDTFADNCSFVLTANYENKLLDPIKSRCLVVRFAANRQAQQELKAAVAQRVRHICECEGVAYHEEAVPRIVDQLYPDIRAILNASEMALCCS